MAWSLDISAAPRGRHITFTETDKDGKLKERQVFRHDRIWLWTKCGRKIESRWLPPTQFGKGRWDGLATSERPVAWHPFAIPADPVFPSEQHIDLPIIEDVGGDV